MIWRLTRYAEGPMWTLGAIHAPASLGLIHTLELGWKDNLPDVSRIPEGDYYAGEVFRDRDRVRLWGDGVFPTEEMMDESPLGERFAVDIHVANSVSELKGCIAVGFGAGTRVTTYPGAAVEWPMLERSGAAVQLVIDAIEKARPRAVRIEIRDRF